MRTTLLPAKCFQSARWSGGSTTELYIFPREADYKQLNFDFRISTATVEVETSLFTPLPAVSRTLMVLDGQMNLVHKGHHTTVLHKNEIDVFDGGWETTSFGCCTDFNLMTRGETSGKVRGFDLQGAEVTALEAIGSHTVIYLYAGSTSVSVHGTDYAMGTGDLLIISEPATALITIRGNEKSQVVFCTIS